MASSCACGRTKHVLRRLVLVPVGGQNMFREGWFLYTWEDKTCFEKAGSCTCGRTKHVLWRLVLAHVGGQNMFREVWFLYMWENWPSAAAPPPSASWPPVSVFPVLPSVCAERPVFHGFADALLGPHALPWPSVKTQKMVNWDTCYTIIGDFCWYIWLLYNSI